MAKSEIFFTFQVSFLGGVFLASLFYFLFSFPPALFLLFLFLVFALLFLFLLFLKKCCLKKKNFLIGILICFSILAGGNYFFWYSGFQIQRNIFWQHFLNGVNKERLVLKIEKILKEKRKTIYLLASDPKSGSKILVYFNKPEVSLNYGDLIQVEGQYFPVERGWFYFQNNIPLVMKNVSFFSIKEKRNKGMNKLSCFLLSLKDRYEEKLIKIFGLEKGGLLAGVVLGRGRNLKESLKVELQRAGLIHFTTLSGYHISIIIFYLLFIFLALGVSRGAAFWFVGLVVSLFVVITGSSPSCLRAAILGLLYLLAVKIEALPTSKYLLSLTAFLMVVLNPKILFFNLGFQLSFLAVIGIFYLFPILKKKIGSYFSWKIFGKCFSEENILYQAFLVTLSAQIMVFPLLIVRFHYFSPFALVANLLVFWLIPLLMLGGFLVGVIAFANIPLATLISYLFYPFLVYFEKITLFFGKFSLSLQVPTFLGVLFLVLSYSLIFYLFLKNKRLIGEEVLY